MNIIEKIVGKVESIYLNSSFYTLTIWDHVSRTAKFAKEFAEKTKCDQFIVEVGGLLHDLGAAKFGKENHHITGVQEAIIVLLECECPLELIGPITSTIYSHRGSQNIPFETPEAKCVAAADALDHFKNIEELWRVQVEDLKILELEVYRELSEKIERDWEKTVPEIKILLDGAYLLAKEELLKIASMKKISKRKKP
ncbi:MAG: HD domain-containing protein [Candidatus Nealsonbacteria bacterium]